MLLKFIFLFFRQWSIQRQGCKTQSGHLARCEEPQQKDCSGMYWLWSDFIIYLESSTFVFIPPLFRLDMTKVVPCFWRGIETFALIFGIAVKKQKLMRLSWLVFFSNRGYCFKSLYFFNVISVISQIRENDDLHTTFCRICGPVSCTMSLGCMCGT